MTMAVNILPILPAQNFKSEVIFSFDLFPVIPRAEHHIPLFGIPMDALIPLAPVAVIIFPVLFQAKLFCYC